MARATKIIKRALKKSVASGKKQVKQRLVRLDNVDRRKAEGYKVVEAHKDRKQLSGSDLVLMEKTV